MAPGHSHFRYVGAVNVHGAVTSWSQNKFGSPHHLERLKMKFSEMATIEAGLMFETKGGVMVKTTGATLHVPSHNVYAHEVVVAEGPQARAANTGTIWTRPRR